MFVFLKCTNIPLIGSIHVKYLHKKDSPWISFSLENAYYLECFHLIFVFVKTKTCMSPPAPLLLFSLAHISPVSFFLLSEISCYLIKYTVIYSQKCMLSRYIFKCAVGLYTDLYLKPIKYSKIPKWKLPSWVIFEMYAYKCIKCMWTIKT